MMTRNRAIPMTQGYSGPWQAVRLARFTLLPDMAKARAIHHPLHRTVVIRVAVGHPVRASCAILRRSSPASRCTYGPAFCAPACAQGRAPPWDFLAKALCAQICDIAAHGFRL